MLKRLLFSMLVFFLAITTIAPAANAETTEEDVIDAYGEKETLDLINFIQTEALQIDEDGNAKVDLQKIEQKLGYIPNEYIEFNNSNKNVNSCVASETTIKTPVASTKAIKVSKYEQCVANEIFGGWKEILGVSAFQAAVEALQQGKKLAAARLLVKAGAKGGIHGLVLTLGWVQVKCLKVYL